MGGEAPVSYLARARYADDLGLAGENRDTFQQFFTALDAEYLAWRSEHDKAA